MYVYTHWWTSRGRSQVRYICPPAHFLCWTPRCHSQAPHLSTFTFPTDERQGAFTSSIHLSTCTFPLLNVKVPFTSSAPVHLHISHCWKSRGRSQARYICPPAHFPALTRKRAVSAAHFHWPTTSLILLPSQNSDSSYFLQLFLMTGTLISSALLQYPREPDSAAR